MPKSKIRIKNKKLENFGEFDFWRYFFVRLSRFVRHVYLQPQNIVWRISDNFQNMLLSNVGTVAFNYKKSLLSKLF